MSEALSNLEIDDKIKDKNECSKYIFRLKSIKYIIKIWIC